MSFKKPAYTPKRETGRNHDCTAMRGGNPQGEIPPSVSQQMLFVYNHPVNRLRDRGAFIYETWMGTNRVQLDASERIVETLLAPMEELKKAN